MSSCSFTDIIQALGRVLESAFTLGAQSPSAGKSIGRDENKSSAKHLRIEYRLDRQIKTTTCGRRKSLPHTVFSRVVAASAGRATTRANGS